MQKFFIFLFLILSSTSFSENIQGLHCGTRGTMLGTIASDTVIPDYFPPEHFLLRLLLVNPLLVDLSVCEEDFSRVHLGASCIGHDRCYRTLGASKDECDEVLIKDWLASCDETYQTNTDESNMCHGACTAMVNLMYAGLRFKLGDWCPSCEAYKRDQDKALSPL